MDEDTDFWVGDPGYVLPDNIVRADGEEWQEPTDPQPGYWAACVRALETPLDGAIQQRPFELPDGLLGLVAMTRWGDGVYPGWVKYDDRGYVESIEFRTW